jgi:hypothetical protein
VSALPGNTTAKAAINIQMGSSSLGRRVTLQKRREIASTGENYRPSWSRVKRFRQRTCRLAKPLLATVEEKNQGGDNSGSLGTLRDRRKRNLE